jgi:hypothetical protein
MSLSRQALLLLMMLRQQQRQVATAAAAQQLLAHLADSCMQSGPGPQAACQAQETLLQTLQRYTVQTLVRLMV